MLSCILCSGKMSDKGHFPRWWSTIRVAVLISWEDRHHSWEWLTSIVKNRNLYRRVKRGGGVNLESVHGIQQQIFDRAYLQVYWISLYKAQQKAVTMGLRAEQRYQRSCVLWNLEFQLSTWRDPAEPVRNSYKTRNGSQDFGERTGTTAHNRVWQTLTIKGQRVSIYHIFYHIF